MRRDEDDHGLYFNQPAQYTMSVACMKLSLSNEHQISRYGKAAIAEQLALAKKLNGMAILIFRTTDVPYETSSESERKYGLPERITIVKPESLTREKIVFSEKPSKRKR